MLISYFLQVLTSLSTPHHILVHTSSDFGVVLPRAGKLICGVCEQPCAAHTKAVTASIQREDEGVADLQYMFDNTETVEITIPSLITTHPIGLQQQLQDSTCNCEDRIMHGRSEQIPVYSKTGTKVTDCM